ncbi:DUF1405 domain-containing protein [Halorussus sp. MSC15.2]|uniref:DUF1405 domain-containing protein n=1 Tax=Halorussus sp. MSC15.2 TaxID=2283638 RepID=UPI0013D0406B|nr:DUF1405 domain-containing protein [Halorussus sp. MSC15.2]NEU55779.1 DUF1405 domain-containing protein [Halorussus sp. MSC15.2]
MATLERYARRYLEDGPNLARLLVVNVLAILVGVQFYVETLPEVPVYLWPFYADSPAALFLVTLSLVTLLPNLGRPLGDAPQNRALAYLHTLAFAWLVKYGVWTFVSLNLGFSAYFGPPWNPDAFWAYWFIIVTHLGFVVEASLLPYFGATTRGALATTLVALLANDAVDYLFGFHPPLRYEPGLLLPVATVALSVLAVATAASAFGRLSNADGSA